MSLVSPEQEVDPHRPDNIKQIINNWNRDNNPPIDPVLDESMYILGYKRPRNTRHDKSLICVKNYTNYVGNNRILTNDDFIRGQILDRAFGYFAYPLPTLDKIRAMCATVKEPYTFQVSTLELFP
jgi:hypothetical protein